MDYLLEPFRYDFMRRAILACLLVGFTNGYLSAYVVQRRLALMADSVSHSLLPGLALAAIFFGLAPLGLFFGSLLAAGLAALGATLIARSTRVKEETAIAALYTIAFALGILLLNFSKVRIDLEHFLFGDILGLGDSDLWVSYAASFVIMAVLVWQQRALLLTIFEPSIAQAQGVPAPRLSYLLVALMVLAMIASLQAVGVILSLGLLVLPAATIYLLSDSFETMTWGGGVLGMGGSFVGLMISYHADIGSGPAIVLVLGACFLGAYFFSPKHGLVFRRG